MDSMVVEDEGIWEGTLAFLVWGAFSCCLILDEVVGVATTFLMLFECLWSVQFADSSCRSQLFPLKADKSLDKVVKLNVSERRVVTI